MRKLPLPDFVVLALAFASVVLVMSTGVRWGVRRKARTSFAGAEFIEDSAAGERGGVDGAGDWVAFPFSATAAAALFVDHSAEEELDTAAV